MRDRLLARAARSKDAVMDPVGPPKPSLQDLMARVGYLLLHWGYLEEELDSAVSALGNHEQNAERQIASRMPVSSKLNHWKQLHEAIQKHNAQHLKVVADLYRDLSEALDTRNVICHCLAGASALGTDDEAYIRVKSGETEIKFSFSDLGRITDRIESNKNSLARLTIAALA